MVEFILLVAIAALFFGIVLAKYAEKKQLDRLATFAVGIMSLSAVVVGGIFAVLTTKEIIINPPFTPKTWLTICLWTSNIGLIVTGAVLAVVGICGTLFTGKCLLNK